MLLFFKKKNSFVKSWKSFGFSGGFVKTNNIFKVDGRFYYGWIMLICGFLSMFICYVIKVNCSPLFITPICKEFGINRTMYAQVNTCLTVAMMISSLFIGKVYKKIPVKFALTGCVAIAALCYVGMSFSHNIVQLYILAIIQGIGWSGATNLPVTIMVSSWFGPKIKGTAMSIGMLGSGAGALVWIRVIEKVIEAHGWRTGYLAMAGCLAIMIPVALIFVVSMPIDKGFETRVGDPTPEENANAVPAQKQGITGGQALKTARWWCQWFAGMITMIGASAFSYEFKNYFNIVLGDKAKATALYAGALGTLILGKFLLGALSDVLKIKRTAVIAPLFYCGVFLCMAFSSTGNALFPKLLVPLYMLGGALPSIIPFLITAHNFGDKEYGVMSGWMNMAGNVGQILGPTIVSIILDMSKSIYGEGQQVLAYALFWKLAAILMVVVAVLYMLSSRVSKKQIQAMGYTPAE